MRLAVLGAAGGVGSHLVRLAVESGHDVVAVARSGPEDGGAVGAARAATWVSGDVRDAGVLHRAVTGADAVLWCVGVTKNSGGDVGRSTLPVLVAAMAEHGVQRFIGVSGAGADLPGDQKGRGARFVSGLTHRLARDLVEDKEHEHAVLAASSLAWTQVRPPRLTDGPGTGRYRLTDQAPGLGAAAVAKADVALAMLDLAGEPGVPADRRWVSAAPYVVAARP